MFAQGSSLQESPSMVSQPILSTTSTLSERVIKTVFDEAKDVSDAARLGRRKAMLRAVCAEFVGTVIYFVPIFGVLANNHTQNVGLFATRISTAGVAALNLVCMIMCFSTLSGAIFNPAIAFSLWITNKLSNRKCILFSITQMLASLMCMCIIWACFPTVDVELWEALTLSPEPGASSWNVFFSEFTCTFILTYAAFAMAFEEAESLKHSTMSVQAAQDSDGLVVFGSDPQSKVGFAPFALGFVVFALSNFGGGSGPSMNPVRIFGPALLANKWDSFIYYILGEFLGAAAGALAVVHGPQSGERSKPNPSVANTDGSRHSTLIKLGQGALNPMSFSSNNHENSAHSIGHM